MPAFEWKEFFSVGHEVMDAQHKQLFAIVNELYDGMKQAGGASEGLLASTIESLCDYTRTHFAEEEYLMLTAGYPGYSRHKQAHDFLIGKVEEFEVRVRNGEVRLAAEVLPFLVGEWLSSHIAFEDQQYAGYIDSQASRLRRKYGPETELLHAWQEPSLELAEA